MKTFKIELINIQHIKQLLFEIDLSLNTLHCIVGKNGVGKTTLIKAIQNFKDTSTIDKLSRVNIIKSDSKIIYTINNDFFQFMPTQHENGRYILESNEDLSKFNNKIYTELPAPDGKRFTLYSTLKENETEVIRKAFSINQYDKKPKALIDILHKVYPNKNFNDLKQISTNKNEFYIQPLNKENYIREDGFSSGEYMIIQIYKLIFKKTKPKMIVIDEIDISLDCSAQVELIKILKNLCETYKINIIFTTHSLAIMRKIDNLSLKLLYMDNIDESISIEEKSFAYIQSLLFQFNGFDKLILTEDEMLENYIKYVLKDETITCKYKIVYIGGASNLVSLMNRNKKEHFFGDCDVKSILDGDQDNYSNHQDVMLLPFESIEKFICKKYNENVCPKKYKKINDKRYDENVSEQSKDCFNEIKKQIKNDHEIFDFIKIEEEEKVNNFRTLILEFLNKN